MTNSDRWKQKVDIAINRGMVEILADIREGRVPSSVQHFSALHDYVDANEYGGLCEDGWVEYEAQDEWTTASHQAATDVQTSLHLWLQNGRKFDEMAVMRAVVALIPHATLEYPGFVFIPAAEPMMMWVAGTINGPWGVDLQTKDGARGLASVETKVSGREVDARVIAKAIDDAMTVIAAEGMAYVEGMTLTVHADPDEVNAIRDGYWGPTQFDHGTAASRTRLQHYAHYANLVATTYRWSDGRVQTVVGTRDNRLRLDTVDSEPYTRLIDVVSRALSVIVESDGADEHDELIAELAGAVAMLQTLKAEW